MKLPGSLALAVVTLAAAVAYAAPLAADPVDAQLVVNGDLELATDAPAPAHLEGALGDKIYSGWRFREPDTNIGVGEAKGRVPHVVADTPQPMALTRFYFDHVWDGSEMLLQSRATDATGYVQPTKAQLREVRGLNSIYHNNCIQTWWIKNDGSAENVEVS